MTKFVNSNSITLAYDSFGEEAAEVILLISGLGTQMIRWTDPFCWELTALGYRVIRFDNRDAGLSTSFAQHGAVDVGTLVSLLMTGQRPSVPYTLADMVRDAVGLLDALSIPQAHVVGRSMGGMIAQVMASEHPSRVLSLTSIMSATGNPGMPSAEPDTMTMMMRPAPDPVLDEAGFLEHGMAFARRIASPAFPFDEEACRALLQEEVRRGRAPGGFGRQFAAVALAGDRRSQLVVIKAPTLVIHGTNDPLFPPACGQDTAASIPDAEMMLIDGMGHDLPAPLFRIVARAIDRTARRSRPSIL